MVEVPSTLSLADFHDVMQVSMGWMDCHMHQFVTKSSVRFERFIDDMDLGFGSPALDESEYRLCDVKSELKRRLAYVYDMGDDWVHAIKLVKSMPLTDTDAPIALLCRDGARACPPEDCGGPWGYMDICDALKVPEASRTGDQVERIEWLGEYDPEAFDLAETNQGLMRLAKDLNKRAKAASRRSTASSEKRPRRSADGSAR